MTADQIANLTYACELLKTASPTEKAANGSTAVSFLLRMSRHDSPIVREGAVYGLEGHLSQPLVLEKLMDMAANDPSEGVREAAGEAYG